MKSVLTWILNLLTIFFGKVHWQLPPWLRFLSNKTKACFQQLSQTHSTNKPKFYGVAGALVVVFGALYGGYTWYQNRPQPVTISVTPREISPTPLKKDAKPYNYIVEFGGSVARLEDVGKSVEKGITLRPQISGTWEWEEDNRLIFRPEKDWPVGSEHTVSFSKQLFPKHIHLETYETTLTTPPLKISSSGSEFYQSPFKAEDKQATFEFRLTHPVDKESLKDHLELIYEYKNRAGKKLKEKKLKSSVSFDKFLGTAYIKSENLDIPDYQSEVVLKIAEGVRAAGSNHTTDFEVQETVQVPGMLDHFQFDHVDLTYIRNEKYESEQVLALTTSVSIKQEDLEKHISVYQLPEHHPTTKKPRRRHRWSKGDVTKDILKNLKTIELESIPTEKEYSKDFTYKFNQEPDTYLYIVVKEGIRSFGGYRLVETKTWVRKVPEQEKEMKIMAQGSLLSLTGEKKISILARDLEHVRFRAQRLLPGQIANFVSQSTYSSLSQPDFNGYYFNFDNITETFSEVQALPVVDRGKTQYSHFDFGRIVGSLNSKPKGLFYFTAEGWDNVNGRTTGPKDKRFILITDIGLLAKKSNDGSFDVFLQSVATGSPISGARVDVIGKNGLSVMSRTTAADGHVRFEGLSDFEREKEPLLFLATKANDLSFLPINSHVNALNYSRFDVGGVRQSSSDNRLEGYIFSDRGIYRPGEGVHLGYIVKNSDWSRDVSGLNLEMEVTDPKGSVIVHRKNLSPTKVGLSAFDFETGATWPTGTYSATLFVKKKKRYRSQVTSVSFKVEEFMPDRLKISAKFSTPPNKGWLKPKDLAGLVDLQNLFGTPAQNRRIKAELQLSPSYPSFSKFRDWTFYDPMRSKKSFKEELGETKTDSEGKARFDFGLEKFESASYMLRFLAEGFELEGGRSVLASNSVLISPLDYLVAFKAEGDLDYIKREAEIGVRFLAVDPDLESIAVEKLKMKIIEYRKISTLVKQSNGTYKYETVSKEYEMSETDFKIARDGEFLKLDTSKAGDFAVVIVDGNDLELNRVRYSVAGEGNLSFDLEKNAELQVKLNKQDFDPGEEIEISIRSPYVGSGLITVERDRVFAHKWFRTTSKSSIQTIRIPRDLEGNGYINVTFVRSLNSNEIFMSPLSSGVAPFSINKESRINRITLSVPELVRPGKDMKIQVSARQKGKALVFAVDEGILQVAKYQTPDPLSSFYKKRALQVETRQILDLILPEFSRLALKKSSESGGAAALLGKNLNPFKRKADKAVAYWSGVIDIGPDSKTLSYSVPDYFSGRLRVMAVAVSENAMDAVSEGTTVRGHFVLSPNVPNFIAPGDTLKISTGVSNNVEGVKDNSEVTVRLETSKNIEILGEGTKTLKLSEGDEGSLVFEVRARAPLGNGSFTFVASLDDKSSRRTATTSVRPASPFRTTLQLGTISKGDDLSLKTPRRMNAQFRSNEVSASNLPLGLSRSMLNYLKGYAYGCTEQLVSKNLPPLIFAGQKGFSLSKQQMTKNLQKVTQILASRQLPSGHFVKWPGLYSENMFHTVYATYFLTEARDRGYPIPKGLMEDALSAIKSFAEEAPENLNMARVQAFAAYTLTRNEIIATQALTSLEDWIGQSKDKSQFADSMVLYMAAAYKMMKAEQKAQSLISRFQSDGVKLSNDYRYGVYNSTIRDAIHLFVLSRHFKNRLDDYGEKRLTRLAEGLKSNYSTTSIALSLLAFDSYGQTVKGSASSGLRVQQWVNGKASPVALSQGIFANGKFDPNSEKVSIDNGTNGLAFYSVSQGGFELKPNAKETHNGIEVFREYLSLDGKSPVSSAKIGSEILVRVRARSIEGNYQSNVAIVDLLPGGFEVVIDSVKRDEGPFEYVDVREDRMLMYGDLTKDVRTFEYRIKAINKGSYQIPAVFSESMYDPSIQSLGISGNMKVE